MNKIFNFHYKDKIEIRPIKNKIIKGTFLYFDRENENGRIYPQKLMKDIFEQLSEKLNEGNVLGELEFPNRPEISLANVSHRVLEIHFNPEKNSLDGTIEILETPSGKKVLAILKQCEKNKLPCSFVIRSRGMGIVDSNTKEVKNFQIFSFDLINKENDAFKNFENEKH